MTSAQFHKELQEILQCDTDIESGTFLWDVEEWDSLAIMACMAYFDRTFGIKTKFGQYKDLGTVAELAALAGGAIHD